MLYARTCMSLLAAAVLLCAGCSQNGGDKPAPNAAQSVTEAAPSSDADAIAKAMAELSPEDRAVAEKQQVCPVSGSPLGSMGKPFKVTVKDRVVFLCCDGCEEEIRKEPDKYLAKLPPTENK
jgi:hypothetical protein